MRRSPRIRIGISACLLGRRVRYDGGHKLDRALRAALRAHADLVPVCPESGCGLGIPREPMRLAGDAAAPRLVTVETGRDVTARLRGWIPKQLRALAKARAAGFVLKSRSPSCAVRDAKLFAPGKRPRRTAGLFARALRERFPAMPIEDSDRLQDPVRLARFLKRIGAAGAAARAGHRERGPSPEPPERGSPRSRGGHG